VAITNASFFLLGSSFLCLAFAHLPGAKACAISEAFLRSQQSKLIIWVSAARFLATPWRTARNARLASSPNFARGALIAQGSPVVSRRAVCVDWLDPLCPGFHTLDLCFGDVSSLAQFPSPQDAVKVHTLLDL